MKKLYVFALLAVMACAAHAQRFEWAKGYTVENSQYRSIVGGVTDSLGNLYILGNCDASSVWDGAEYILPSINKTAKDLPNNVLIAKISTEGEMVWKKVLFDNHGGYNPYDIKKLGDTAFACITEFKGITDHGYIFFLDTFLVTPNNYPIDVRYYQSKYLAYLVFDFDGNVKEHHFLTITYTDADGNDIVDHNTVSGDTTPWLKGIEGFRCPSFDVDGEGNIYISRFAVDQCSGAGAYLLTPEDSIRGLKFWVDRRLVGEYRIEGRPSLWFPQVIKFSPHFDTLLNCRYVIQKWNIDGHTPLQTYTKVDMYGNVYCIPLYLARNIPGNDTIVVDSLLYMEFVRKARGVGFLASYNSEFNTRWIITYDDSLIDATRWYAVQNNFYDIDFDYDSNLIFLSAASGRSAAGDTINYISALSYRGEALPLKDGVSIASFYNTDSIPVMHSYSVVPAGQSLISDGSLMRGNIFCKNNRIALQCCYFGGIMFPSQTIRYNTLYHTGIGLIVFDYMGNVIDGIDYGSMLDGCTHNYTGPIVAHDSVLYLCNRLITNARFGNIDFPVYGETNCIAKYVDTSLMHPYVRPTHGIETVSAVAPRVYPVPASERLYFDSPDGGVPTAVTAISLSGWRMPLPATATSADISCLAPGVYILEITTAKGKYHTKFVKQ